MNNDDFKIEIIDETEYDLFYDISDRILRARDRLSLDIVSKNILENFEYPQMAESINYVSKFKEAYILEKENNIVFPEDIEIVNEALTELCQIVLTGLNTKFFVSLGDNVEDDTVSDLKELLDNIEALYEFFIVRHYTNLKDYFKNKIMNNKLKFVEQYKTVLEEDKAEDLFLSQDNRKFKDKADSIILHFINEIIHDIRSDIESGYEFFKEIVNLDLYEEVNHKVSELLNNYGNDIVMLDDSAAAKAYLKVLDDPEFFNTMKNDILVLYLEDVMINE